MYYFPKMNVIAKIRLVTFHQAPIVPLQHVKKKPGNIDNKLMVMPVFPQYAFFLQCP